MPKTDNRAAAPLLRHLTLTCVEKGSVNKRSSVGSAELHLLEIQLVPEIIKVTTSNTFSLLS